MARPTDAGERAQSHPPSYLRVTVRAPKATRARRAGPRTVSARLSAQAKLEARPDGHVFVLLEGYSLDLGWFSAAPERVLALHTGVPLASFGSRRSMDRDFTSLAQRLARHGFLEYPSQSATRTWSSSNRKCQAIGRKRHR